MLPATGKFREIDCPFFENNCCDRPYCHFKHNKKERSKEREKLILKELVAKSVKQLLTGDIKLPDSLFANEEKISKVVEANNEEKNNKVPDYQPTPINELSKQIELENDEEESEDVMEYAPKEKMRHIPVPYTPLQPDKYKRRGSLFSSLLQNDYSPQSYTSTTEQSPSKTYHPTPINSIKIVESGYEPISQSSTSEFKEYMPESLEDNGSTCLPSYNPTPKLNESLSESQLSDVMENIDFDSFEEEFDMIQGILDEESKSGKKHYNKKDVKKADSSSEKSKDKSKTTSEKSVEKPNAKSNKRSSSKSSSEVNLKKSSSSKSKSENKHVSSSSKKQQQRSSHSSKEKDQKHKSSSSSSNNDKKQLEKKHKSSSKLKHRDSTKTKGDKDKIKSESKPSDVTTTYDCRETTERNKTNEEITPMSDSDDENGFLDTSAELSFSDSESREDCMNECYEIFKSYSNTKTHSAPAQKIETISSTKEESELSKLSKKRVAHANADKDMSRKGHAKAKKPIPAMVMMQRYASAIPKVEAPPPEHFYPEPKKKRISHVTSTAAISSTTQQPQRPRKISAVSNVQSLLLAKAKVQEQLTKQSAAARILGARNSATDTGASKTPAHTISKGGRRVAHTPDVPSISEWPSVLNPEKTKLPVNVRIKFYHLLVEDCMKMYPDKKEAFDRAQKEELNCFNRCNTLVTYKNSAMLCVSRLRKEAANPAQYTAAKLTVWTCIKKFHEAVREYCMSKEDFELNGYPLECGSVGQAIFKTYRVERSLPPDKRSCARCHKTYSIDKYGYPTVKETCNYHHLRKRTIRGEGVYLCCKSNSEFGCNVSNTHVSESLTGKGPIDGYQQTMPPNGPDDPRSHQVYALDCEMCYTTKGLELTRLTVIDMNLKIVYDSFIKPLHEILDYNTQFSGIIAKDLESCATNIVQAQATILSMCNSKTILIGHSLESDLKAMKIIHGTVIDTALLFPHRLGAPYKRALRTLAAEFLKKIIQNNECGHDSAEDAITCMELVKWRLTEDLKLK